MRQLPIVLALAAAGYWYWSTHRSPVPPPMVPPPGGAAPGAVTPSLSFLRAQLSTPLDTMATGGTVRVARGQSLTVTVTFSHQGSRTDLYGEMSLRAERPVAVNFAPVPESDTPQEVSLSVAMTIPRDESYALGTVYSAYVTVWDQWSGVKVYEGVVGMVQIGMLTVGYS